MTKMRTVWASGAACAFMVTLALPISAGAFGRSPSQSEVFDQPGQMASPGSMDVGGALAAAVPEPSSLLLAGIALGVAAVVAIWKRKHQATEEGQAK